MTTSGRFCELHHPEILEDKFERGQAGDVPDVERRRDLIDVEPGKPHTAKLVQEVEQLARGEPAGRGDACAGCDRRIERIDVERDMSASPPMREPISSAS